MSQELASTGKVDGDEPSLLELQQQSESVVDAVDLKATSNVQAENNNENGNGHGPNNQQGDGTDSRFFSFNSFTSSSRTTVIENVGVLKVDFDSLNYAMNSPRRGKCLIINHQHYDRQLQLNVRNGTEVDGKALQSTFETLGFDVETMPDPTFEQIQIRLKMLASEDHTHADCLAVCVMTHGEQSSLWARDFKYRVDKLYEHFTADKCLTLAGKPKLFFIQACQGSDFDRGTTVVRHQDVADSASCYKIPNWYTNLPNQLKHVHISDKGGIPMPMQLPSADFLIVYSTVPGHFSWRNPRLGSWFVQALTQVFERFSHQYDLLSMLTIVNQYVAYNFESVSDLAEYHGNKQVACITSMLTRRVFFGASV